MPHSAEVGVLAEKIAEKFYLAEGYTLVARNFRLPCGEIDLILRRGRELLFVEVKGRKNFLPDEAWSPRWRQKKQRLRRTANIFLMRHRELRDAADEVLLEIVFVTQGRVSHRFEGETFF